MNIDETLCVAYVVFKHMYAMEIRWVCSIASMGVFFNLFNMPSLAPNHQSGQQYYHTSPLPLTALRNQKGQHSRKKISKIKHINMSQL